MSAANLPSERAARPPSTAPTLEAWARAYLETETLADKLSPAVPPELIAGQNEPPPRRPGRPAELSSAKKSSKTPGKDALREPSRRAQILHTFFHHELQAAELFAWAILAYPEADSAFRRGLGRLLLDEARHMRMYAARIRALGQDIGAFPVRDWFWDRVPAATTPKAFVATLGLGFEGGNLDHAARFAERFAAAGDEESAALQRVVATEEEPHVRFALRWFARFSGCEVPDIAFADFGQSLPPPLTPGLMRGKTVHRDARLRAGFPASFLDDLAACPLVSPGSLTSTPISSSLAPGPSRPPTPAARAWSSWSKRSAGSWSRATSCSTALLPTRACATSATRSVLRLPP